MHQPLVSIILVNYRQAEATADCLRACQALTYPHTELIVVDNGALDDPSPRWRAVAPGLKVLPSPQNLGFAKANNLGLAHARGEFVLFLNNDTLPAPGLLEPLVEALQTAPELGGVSPVILKAQPEGQIQFAGYTHIHPLTGRNRIRFEHQPYAKVAEKAPYETAYLHGAAMLLRQEAIAKAGYMPEGFFLYYEEIEWSVRLKQAGYAFKVVPQAQVIHHGSLSVGAGSVVKTYYYQRNRILFMRRNHRGWSLAGFALYYLLIAMPWQVIRLLWQRRGDHLRAYLRALIWHLKPGNPDAFAVEERV
jgi:GT2 family glycosyltransferase